MNETLRACFVCGATAGLCLTEDGWACADWQPCAARARQAKTAAGREHRWR